MLPIIVPAAWALFAVYAFWYATSAKHNVPITVNDARILWKTHKKNTNCDGHKWRPIACRGGKVLGFECECGYKYKQKRHIVPVCPE